MSKNQIKKYNKKNYKVNFFEIVNVELELAIH